MSERTPGPLRCIPNPYDGMFQVVNEKDQIACLGVWEEDGTLFAAAPELLEAANAMLDAFGESAWMGKEAQALDLLMDAINKAEGHS